MDHPQATESHSTPHTTPIALLLRLLPREGRQRRLVGQAEVIDTGEIVTIADEAQLIGLVQRLSAGQPSG